MAPPRVVRHAQSETRLQARLSPRQLEAIPNSSWFSRQPDQQPNGRIGDRLGPSPRIRPASRAPRRRAAPSSTFASMRNADGVPLGRHATLVPACECHAALARGSRASDAPGTEGPEDPKVVGASSSSLPERRDVGTPSRRDGTDRVERSAARESRIATAARMPARVELECAARGRTRLKRAGTPRFKSATATLYGVLRRLCSELSGRPRRCRDDEGHLSPVRF